MLRFILYALKLAALLAVTVWLADAPGRVRFDWLGYEVETTAAFLMLVILALLAGTWLLGKIIFKIGFGWRLARQQRLLRQQKQGVEELTKTLNALAGQDVRSAEKYLTAARKKLGALPLLLWLDAQLAEKRGDGARASKDFAALISTPSTTTLGWRGLISARMKSGDAGAQQMLQLALADKTIAGQAFVHEARLAAAVRAGNWAEFAMALTVAENARALPRHRLKHLHMVADLLRGEAEAATHPDGALDLLARAYKAAPDFLPAAIAYAKQLMLHGQAETAEKVISTAWLHRPHVDLLALFITVTKNLDPLARLQKFERFAKKRADHPATQQALATLSLAAGLDGKATSHDTQARDLISAESSASSPEQRCENCGALHQHWQPFCFNCGSFASLHYYRAS